MGFGVLEPLVVAPEIEIDGEPLNVETSDNAFPLLGHDSRGRRGPPCFTKRNFVSFFFTSPQDEVGDTLGKGTLSLAECQVCHLHSFDECNPLLSLTICPSVSLGGWPVNGPKLPHVPHGHLPHLYAGLATNQLADVVFAIT